MESNPAQKREVIRRVQLVAPGAQDRGYRSACNTGGEWLTMSEAATKFGVTNHQIRRVVEAGLLPTEQIMPGASHQIRAADLEKPAVKAAISHNGPCRVTDQDQKSLFSAI